MTLSRFVVSVALGGLLFIAVPPAAAQPESGGNGETSTIETRPDGTSDADVARVVAEYHKKVEVAAKEGKALNTVMPGLADEAVDQLKIPKLSISQLESLRGSAILLYTTRFDPLMKRTEELMAVEGPAGARAGIVALALTAADKDEKHQAKVIQAALRHPALRDSIRAGKVNDFFVATQLIPVPATKYAAPDVVTLFEVLPDEMPPGLAWQTSYLVDMVLNSGGDVTPEQIDRLRQRALAIQERALAAMQPAPENPDEEPAATRQPRRRLQQNIAYLGGRFARNQLMVGDAPDMDFIWCSTEPSIKKLSDLKGKVVLLDFWATWCGPCRAAFPSVRRIAEHYQGYPVVVLGVTSIQGSHTDTAGKKTDCKGDAAKEMSLMPELIAGKQITWPVVYSAQTVFNPDYGVRGIPHVVLIDATGKVRHRGLNPMAGPDHEVKLIDSLLSEAGLPVPPVQGKGEEASAPAGSETKR